MKYDVDQTSRFKKDLKVMQKQGRDSDRLLSVIEVLASGQPLDRRYKDHKLTGQYSGYRECHIEPDWALIYELHESEKC